MNLQEFSLLGLPGEILKAQISLNQQLYFSLLPIRLDLAELTLWDYSIQACVYVKEKDSDPPSFVEQLFGLH